jgi:hypothetical protein
MARRRYLHPRPARRDGRGQPPPTCADAHVCRKATHTHTHTHTDIHTHIHTYTHTHTHTHTQTHTHTHKHPYGSTSRRTDAWARVRYMLTECVCVMVSWGAWCWQQGHPWCGHWSMSVCAWLRTRPLLMTSPWPCGQRRRSLSLRVPRRAWLCWARGRARKSLSGPLYRTRWPRRSLLCSRYVCMCTWPYLCRCSRACVIHSHTHILFFSYFFSHAHPLDRQRRRGRGRWHLRGSRPSWCRICLPLLPLLRPRLLMRW